MSENSDFDIRDKLDMIEFKSFPVNIIIMEKLQFTLDELLDDMNYLPSEDEWFSILFQIIFSLTIAQKYFKMWEKKKTSANSPNHVIL